MSKENFLNPVLQINTYLLHIVFPAESMIMLLANTGQVGQSPNQNQGLPLDRCTFLKKCAFANHLQSV